MSDQPPSDGDGTGAPRILLPKNIAQTLRYLDDPDLGALRGAVEQEWQRRRLGKREVPAEGPKAAPPVSPGRGKAEAKQAGSALPLCKASVIRASAQSGMRPQAIARTLRVSLAQVNEVLGAKAERKR
jgi:hypothetical protein